MSFIQYPQTQTSDILYEGKQRSTPDHRALKRTKKNKQKKTKNKQGGPSMRVAIRLLSFDILLNDLRTWALVGATVEA